MDVGGTRKCPRVAVFEGGLLMRRCPPDEMPSGGQTYSGELPTGGGLKEVAVGRPRTIRGGGAGPPAQDHLAGHELAVVFGQGTRKGLVSGIAGVGAGRPF